MKKCTDIVVEIDINKITKDKNNLPIIHYYVQMAEYGTNEQHQKKNKTNKQNIKTSKHKTKNSWLLIIENVKAQTIAFARLPGVHVSVDRISILSWTEQLTRREQGYIQDDAQMQLYKQATYQHELSTYWNIK